MDTRREENRPEEVVRKPEAVAKRTEMRVLDEQPRPQEPMSMSASGDKGRLRGGGDTGAICCGICAGLACFECLDCCC